MLSFERTARERTRQWHRAKKEQKQRHLTEPKFRADVPLPCRVDQPWCDAIRASACVLVRDKRGQRVSRVPTHRSVYYYAEKKKISDTKKIRDRGRKTGQALAVSTPKLQRTPCTGACKARVPCIILLAGARPLYKLCHGLSRVGRDGANPTRFQKFPRFSRVLLRENKNRNKMNTLKAG